MRLRKSRGYAFGFDAAGRLCELSRADRNRRRRGLDPRTIGARSANYGAAPDAREWRRALRDLPVDVALFSFEHHGPYDWWFTLGTAGHHFTFAPTDGTGWLTCVSNRLRRDQVVALVVLGRRKHPRRARSLVAEAIRRLPELAVIETVRAAI